MLRDLRLAARLLLRARAWTAVLVVSLALGIGANTALFGAMNGLLLREVAVRDPDTLVRLRHTGAQKERSDVLVFGYAAPDARGRDVEATFSYPMYQQLRHDNRTLSDLAAWAPFGRVNLVVRGQADIATANVVSGNYYQMLGVPARLGRTIAEADDRATAPPVAVISHAYWMSRFGGTPDVVGTAVRVNDVPVTIVGVLAPGFTGVERALDAPPSISLPLVHEPRLTAVPASSRALPRLAQPAFWWLHLMGRTRPGVTAAQVQGNLAGVFAHAARAGFDTFLSSLPPAERARASSRGRAERPELLVDSGSRGIYDADPTDLRAVTVLSAVVGLVLLLVCANVANLLLSRAAARQKEISVRLALGATRARLARQLLTESLLLAGLGGTLGLLVGRWGQRLLPGDIGQPSPLDWRVLAFAAAATVLTGVAFGLAPALRSTRPDLHTTLKAHSRGIAGTRSLLGRSLVVAQVAISLVLLSGAGLLLRTLQNLRQVDVGFNPRNLVLVQVNPALNRYDLPKRGQLYDRIGAQLRALPGVRAVGWSDPAPLSGRRFRTNLFVEGRTYPPGQRDPISSVIVSPTFFETMEMPLVAGRGFTAHDTAAAPPVAVINEAAARLYFPNESPIGRRIGESAAEAGQREIVGILRDVKYASVRDEAPATVYVPARQTPQFSTTFEVRTAGDAVAAIAGIREAVRRADPDLPLVRVTTQMDEIEERFLQERMFAQAYTLFGGLALIIAAVGLFGVMSHSVARRTNEIGIRMTLGAQRRDLLRLIMGESLILVIAGIAMGIAGAIAASRLVATLLFGLAPTDPIAMAGALIVMLLVSALAGYLPARRASRVDPTVALRSE